MATVDSFRFYLSRTSNRSGWDIHCDLYEIAAYDSSPKTSTPLGSSDTVLVDTLPVNGLQSWITFDCSSPITVTSGWYQIHLWGDSNDYETTGVHWYGSDNWNPELDGNPSFEGKEGTIWYTAGGSVSSRAYTVYTTDISGNEAETPNSEYGILGDGGQSKGTWINIFIGGGNSLSGTIVGTSTLSGSFGGHFLSGTIAGVSTFSLGTGLPGVPTDPSPSNAATGVNLSSGFSWTNGANTDTSTLYFSINGGGFQEVISGLEAEAYELAQDLLEYGASVIWVVGNHNDYGTTSGPEWTFTAMSNAPPVPSFWLIPGGSGNGPYDDPPGVEGTDFRWYGGNNMITAKTLIAVAQNRVWFQDY